VQPAASPCETSCLQRCRNSSTCGGGGPCLTTAGQACVDNGVACFGKSDCAIHETCLSLSTGLACAGNGDCKCTSCACQTQQDDTACDGTAWCGVDPNNAAAAICIDKQPNCPDPAGTCDRCPKASACSSGFCQMSYCCNVGGCCKGCRVTDFVSNFGGGGADNTGPDVRVEQSVGQQTPSGTSILPAKRQVDFGFLPQGTVQMSH
jgi:hypothetical protein